MSFTKEEIERELARRAAANKRRDTPPQTTDKDLADGGACIHCGGPVDVFGNEEYSLCGHCLHDD